MSSTSISSCQSLHSSSDKSYRPRHCCHGITNDSSIKLCTHCVYRKITMGNPRIQARVPPDLKKQIEEEAAETDKSQSEVARERIQESYDSSAADAASELADEMNQRYARPAPVAGLEEAAVRANETAMYGSVLSLLALALSALPSLVTLAPLIATVAGVISVTVAALGVLNITTAVIGTLYRTAKIVTAAGSSSAPQSTN
jgi:methionyl-tRNA synthetase